MRSRHGLSMIRLTILAAAIGALSGCVSLSTFQTAEALKNGEIDLGIGMTATTVSPTLKAETDEVYEDVTYTTPEFLWRYGVGRRFDIGGKFYGLSPFFGVTFDVKYQFQDGERFDSAIDLGLGTMGVEIDNDDTSYLDYYGAFLFTYLLSDTASLTLSPKSISRRIETSTDSFTETIAGGTLTLQLGKEDGMKILPEVGLYTSDEADFIHYALGFKW